MPRQIAAANKAGHVTHGNVLEDLGFSAEEIREAELKMAIWRPIRAQIQVRGLTQAQLAECLKIHQPDASLLQRGKLSKFSIMKLMQFAERLSLSVRLRVEPIRGHRGTSAKGEKALPAKAKPRAKIVA
jgi:predicted XRE-type DNA-binding protein